MILGESLRLAGIGIATGIIGALALSRVLKGMLVGVSTTDATVFATAALGIGVIAMAACYIPARRATTVDPVVALRYE
jgi:ABC-type antimicrobial peptide transport system permease subunit